MEEQYISKQKTEYTQSGNAINNSKINTFEKKNNNIYKLLIIFILIGLIYWERMNRLPPWYDELYTYREFISKGIRYSATHWPLPNNHILFSILSSGLQILTDNRIFILRGISFVSFMMTAAFLYLWIRKITNENTGLLTVILFATGSYAHKLGIQGRGYSLSMLLFTAALYSCTNILSESNRSKKFFIIYTISITLGVYCIPSNLYWILCLFFCTVIGLRKHIRDLLKFVLCSCAGAFLTCLLYTPVWLTLGSDNSEKALFETLSSGIKMMMSNKFIQPISRSDFNAQVFSWIKKLGNEILYRTGYFPLCLILGLTITIYFVCRFRISKKTALAKFPFYLHISRFGIYLTVVNLIILCIQCVLPYTRIFVHLGVLFAVIPALAFFLLEKCLPNRLQQALMIISLLFMAICFKAFISYQNNKIIAGNKVDKNASDIVNEILPMLEYETVAFGDSYGRLHAFFNDVPGDYKYNPDKHKDLPDVLILNTEQTEPGHPKQWATFYTYEMLPWEKISDEMKIIYRNNIHTIYVKN